MKLLSGKFTISYSDRSTSPTKLEQEGLVLGRLLSCDVILNHHSVSRVHAGINRVETEYVLMNLSVSNSLTLNGRLVATDEADVLADGDIIQIGPFTLAVARIDDELELTIAHQFAGDLQNISQNLPPLETVIPERRDQEIAGVLSAFWEKRTRDKEDSGSRLRPKDKPQPGKARINWKPTGDLGRSWRFGLFVWTFLVVGVLAVYAFYRYPNSYVSQPLSSPHVRNLSNGEIGNRANANSCTTCHSPREPMENSCIKCHQAEQFHASNTKAHQEAGVTCTVCHQEHKGENFRPRTAAIQGCAECHNDANKQLYNGISVRTAHEGSFGRPVENEKWVWKGLYTEIAETMPSVSASRTKDETAQMRLSRQFHALHLFRLKPSEGMKTDSSNRVSCSSCHNSFDPVDRETPYQTCAGCHNGFTEKQTGQGVIDAAKANCISCHVQHPFGQNRWSDFLTDEARTVRKAVIDEQLRRLREK